MTNQTEQTKVTIQELAQAKQKADDAEEARKAASRAYDKATTLLPEAKAYNAAGDNAVELHDEYLSLEARFKTQLITKYNETEEKQHPGGSVAVGKKFKYDDSLIIPWLREHNHPELITEGIKKAGVKKLAQAVEVAGVTTEETLTPKINKDLSEFLTA